MSPRSSSDSLSSEVAEVLAETAPRERGAAAGLVSAEGRVVPTVDLLPAAAAE